MRGAARVGQCAATETVRRGRECCLARAGQCAAPGTVRRSLLSGACRLVRGARDSGRCAVGLCYECSYGGCLHFKGGEV